MAACRQGFGCHCAACLAACGILLVLLPLHLFAAGWSGIEVDLASFFLMLLASLCCLHERGDEWLLPFLLALFGFLAVTLC
jgi:uncharacterized membrane-anchored protein YitT (DUF2179 family)